jgi:hypothetical protein
MNDGFMNEAAIFGGASRTNRRSGWIPTRHAPIPVQRLTRRAAVISPVLVARRRPTPERAKTRWAGKSSHLAVGGCVIIIGTSTGGTA